MRRIVLVALASVAVLVGCSETPNASSTTASRASTQPASVAATTDAPGSVEHTPTLPASPAPASPAPASPAPVSAPTTDPVGNGPWCAVAVDLHDLTTAFRELDAAEVGAVQMSLVAILERLAAIAPLAPPALADDLAVSTEAFVLLDAALAEVDYELGEADLTALDARSDAITAANERIRAYNARECGIDVGVTGAEAP